MRAVSNQRMLPREYNHFSVHKLKGEKETVKKENNIYDSKRNHSRWIKYNKTYKTKTKIDYETREIKKHGRR